jgi:hypothetical protein
LIWLFKFPFVLYHLQTILSVKQEGEAKIAELQSRVNDLCENEDLEESRREEVQQSLRDKKEQWRLLLESAKRAVEEEEKQCALEGLLRDVRAQRKSTMAWLEDKQQALLTLDQTDLEKSMNSAQVRRDMG